VNKDGIHPKVTVLLRDGWKLPHYEPFTLPTEFKGHVKILPSSNQPLVSVRRIPECEDEIKASFTLDDLKRLRNAHMRMLAVRVIVSSFIFHENSKQ
jgi:hypothetical protein